MSSDRIVNFSAGPAAIPLEVLEEVQANLTNYKGAGLSVMEMSHRSKEYDEIHENAINYVKELYSIPDNYSVLFLQGGASHQFAMVPMNLANENVVDVVNTGSWTKKAIGELKGYQHRVVASSESDNFLKLQQLRMICLVRMRLMRICVQTIQFWYAIQIISSWVKCTISG